MSRLRMPLWVALALPFGLVLLTSIGILIGAQRLTSDRLIEASGRNLLFATSDHMRAEVISHLNVIFSQQLSLADLLVRQDLVQRGDMAAVQALFSGHFKSIYRPYFPQVGMIQLGTERGEFFGIKVGPDGRLQTFLKDRRTAQRLISYDTESGVEQARIERYDPRQRPWYTPAARLGQPRWTEVYLSSFGDSTSISATTPVYRANGQLAGVLGTDVSLNDLSTWLRRLPLLQENPSALAYVVDPQGRMLAHSHVEEARPAWKGQILTAAQSHHPLVQASFKALDPLGEVDAAEFSVEQGGQRYFGRNTHLRDQRGLNWRLVALVAESDLNGMARETAKLALVLVLSLSGAGLLVGMLVLRRISHPIRQAARAATLLAAGPEAPPAVVEASHIHEIATLTDAFNAMSQRIRAQLGKLHDMALLDAVTGLPNREGLMAASRWPERRAVTLLLFGVDRFRAVNASLGPRAGDELLRLIGMRLRSTCPTEALVGRVSGDEFLVVLQGAGSQLQTESIIRNLRGCFSEPFQTDTDEVLVGASLGVVSAHASGAEFERDLLRFASAALQKAKSGERGQRVDFDDSLLERNRLAAELTTDMHVALAQGQFQVYFQPLVSLDTGALCGLEALLRWQHPRRGTISPAQFIPLAEESGLIVELGHWVMRQAAVEVAQLMQDQALGPGFIVHVNVSQRQLVQADFIDRVHEVLQRSALPASALVIEITESLLVEDDPVMLATLGELQALGVGLALDDFGTGYSSLSYLNKFPFTEIKIDRSFLVAAQQSARSAAILKSFIDITHSLQVPAIAEGVETEEQAELLRSLNCTLGQGYLFGHPAPMAEMWHQWSLTHPRAGAHPSSTSSTPCT